MLRSTFYGRSAQGLLYKITNLNVSSLIPPCFSRRISQCRRRQQIRLWRQCSWGPCPTGTLAVPPYCRKSLVPGYFQLLRHSANSAPIPPLVAWSPLEFPGNMGHTGLTSFAVDDNKIRGCEFLEQIQGPHTRCEIKLFSNFGFLFPLVMQMNSEFNSSQQELSRKRFCGVSDEPVPLKLMIVKVSDKYVHRKPIPKHMLSTPRLRYSVPKVSTHSWAALPSFGEALYKWLAVAFR